jgi:hypothetical protein
VKFVVKTLPDALVACSFITPEVHMDIGQAQIAALVSIAVFDEFFKAMYRTGVIPAVTTSDQDTPLGPRNVTVRLEPPEFFLSEPSEGPRTLLRLSGAVELRAAGVTDGPTDFTSDFTTTVRLNINLEPRPGQPPMGRLMYAGVHESPAFPLTDQMVTEFFTSPEVETILDGVELDLFTPIIDSLEANLFPDDPPPPRDAWRATYRLLHGATDSHVDSMSIQVALPGQDPGGGDDHSQLPALTEFGIIYSRQLLNTILEAQAEAQIGTEVDEAKITSLSLTMKGKAMHIDGRAERNGGAVTFAGPIRLHLIRGTTQFAVDADEVEVDVKLPWWLSVLMFLSGPGGLLTFGLSWLVGHAIFASQGTSWREVQADLDAAPGRVQSAISAVLEEGLSALAEGLSFSTSMGAVVPQGTPDHSLVQNGHIAVFAQLFMNPMRSAISDGYYQRRGRRLGELQLENGRWFAAAELARLVKVGLITTPGYHAVEQTLANGRARRYMRANPDDRLSNNLLKRFKEAPA